MRKNTFLVLALFLIHSLFVVSQNQANESESNQNEENIQDSAVIVPESLNESLGNLLHNWQVDFSNSKNECDNGENIVYSDSVYIERLYNLPTEMELSFNSVVRTYIEMYTARRRDLVSYMLSLGDYYYPIFEEVLDRYELPLELKYLPVIESALNPVAVSRMGATGLWQFMLRTGQQYQLEVNSLVDERRDPYKATEAAARFLSDLYQIYGDWNLVIAAYNCGPGNVNKAIARSGGKQDYWDIYYQLPKETRGYVPAFIAANYVMNYNNEHNICPQESSNDFLTLDTVHVTSEIHFNQISSVLDIPIEDIRRYNPQYKQDKIPGNHKSYALVLPTKDIYAFLSNKDDILDHNRSIFLTHRKETLTESNDGTTVTGDFINTYYKIKKGDTLGAIARRNGTTVSRLQSMNNMHSTKLSIGKTLIVRQTPRPTPAKEDIQEANTVLASGDNVKNTYYRVKKGDTLGAIASRNQTSVAQLQTLNNLKSTRLSIGDNLIVKQTIEPQQEEVETANKEINHQRSDSVSTPNSGNIVTEYLNKKLELSKDNT
ncbi:MAG TPA: LysM peptidoglycan-binding domain-containing protein [Dysgonamonadaceae bacterium]|nr:LysM peptidoglycan-binding domain-containing protein [Dysgonamonadaceae bacterium]